MYKVLLVDDDRVNCDLIQMLLELDGFEVVVTPTLEQARQNLSPAVDAVVLDRNLGQDANGIDLLKEIRAGQTKAKPNLVAIVASGDDRREEEALEAGANKFMLKPFSPSDLSDDLQALIAAASQ
jgi:DNA-binding response OmpR family regulator